MPTPEEHERKIIDAIQLVAETARDALDEAEVIDYRGDRGVFLPIDDVHQIRAAIGAWTRAGHEMVEDVRSSATDDDDDPETGSGHRFEKEDFARGT